jgi:predicted aldo/keto reductase-like oxidoreductase
VRLVAGSVRLTRYNNPMQRMILGRTGLETYRLGFGGIPIQRVSEPEAVETVAHAIERGVDFIDTSRAYSTSERRIGLALKEVGAVDSRDFGGADRGAGSATGPRVILASKSHAKTADAMRAHLETSLKELQRDYIDIYKAHFVSTHADYETVISPGGALEALVRARDEGLIGHIGLTGHSLEVLDRCLDDGLFDVIMVCFSLLEPQARETIIPKALEKNVGVLAMKPFSGGVIEDARLALKYALGEPGVLVLAGVERPDLFDEGWGVFQEGASLTEAEQSQIAELQRGYDKVFCRRCDYCQPCSEGISIQTALGIRALVKRMGKETLQKSPLWAGIDKARTCTECGECLPRCPYELPIPDLMRENLRWLDELG